MTTQGNGQPVRFDVSMSQANRAVLKQLHLQAVQAGTGQRFVAAYREIIERLHKDPLTFGEAQYRLPALRLLVCQAIVRPLVVDFAVHEDRPLVFIRGFRLLSSG
jgi:hypothetical protein